MKSCICLDPVSLIDGLISPYNFILFILLFLRNYDFMRISGLSRKHFRNAGISELRFYLSRDTRFPTMWYVRPAKAQTSLCIRPV